MAEKTNWKKINLPDDLLNKFDSMMLQEKQLPESRHKFLSKIMNVYENGYNTKVPEYKEIEIIKEVPIIQEVVKEIIVEKVVYKDRIVESEPIIKEVVVEVPVEKIVYRDVIKEAKPKLVNKAINQNVIRKIKSNANWVNEETNFFPTSRNFEIKNKMNEIITLADNI